MSDLDILYRQMWRSFALVVGVFVVGVCGYYAIGYPEYDWLDAVYMTVITLTTVGYGEIIDLSARPGGRIFTVVLLVSGVGAFLSFVSSFTAFWVEGQAHNALWRRRMQRSVRGLSDHLIVAGAGHTGGHIVRELIETDRPFVLIEADEERALEVSRLVGQDIPTVIGDATEDDTLREAGIERASTLVACISSDKDNLIVTVSARILNPGLRIVCRCIDERTTDKILKAGADSVVSPNRIGGLRLVSEAVRPTAVAYLDRMLRDNAKQGLRVESTQVELGSALAQKTVAELYLQRIDGFHLLALQRADDGQWDDHPQDTAALRPGDQLVYTGGPHARQAIERLAGA